MQSLQVTLPHLIQICLYVVHFEVFNLLLFSPNYKRPSHVNPNEDLGTAPAQIIPVGESKYLLSCCHNVLLKYMYIVKCTEISSHLSRIMVNTCYKQVFFFFF